MRWRAGIRLARLKFLCHTAGVNPVRSLCQKYASGNAYFCEPQYMYVDP